MIHEQDSVEYPAVRKKRPIGRAESSGTVTAGQRKQTKAQPDQFDRSLFGRDMVVGLAAIDFVPRRPLVGLDPHSPTFEQNHSSLGAKRRPGSWRALLWRKNTLERVRGQFCASSLLKTHWKRCGLNRGQRSTGGWLRYVRHLGCACVSTVDRMSQTAAVEDEETVISNTALGSSVVAVMQSAQASPRDYPSAPD